MAADLVSVSSPQLDTAGTTVFRQLLVSLLREMTGGYLYCQVMRTSLPSSGIYRYSRPNLAPPNPPPFHPSILFLSVFLIFSFLAVLSFTPTSSFSLHFLPDLPWSLSSSELFFFVRPSSSLRQPCWFSDLFSDSEMKRLTFSPLLLNYIASPSRHITFTNRPFTSRHCRHFVKHRCNRFHSRHKMEPSLSLTTSELYVI